MADLLAAGRNGVGATVCSVDKGHQHGRMAPAPPSKRDREKKRSVRSLVRGGTILVWLLLMCGVILVPGYTQADGSPSSWVCLLPRCGYNLRLGVIPSAPTPDDEIQVVCSGDWYDSCVPHYLSHQVIGNLIQVYLVWDYPPDAICLTMITPWRYTVDVGRLPEGSYRVDLYLASTVPWHGGFCASKMVAVGEELYKAYLPVVAGEQALP